jgi:hypothetical protein
MSSKDPSTIHIQPPLRRRGKNLLQKYTDAKFMKRGSKLLAKPKVDAKVNEQDQRDEIVDREEGKNGIDGRNGEVPDTESKSAAVTEGLSSKADETTSGESSAKEQSQLTGNTQTEDAKKRLRTRSLSSKHDMNPAFWQETDKVSDLAKVASMEEGKRKGHLIPLPFRSFMSRSISMKTETSTASLLEKTEEVSPVPEEAEEEERESVPAKDDTSQTTNTSIASSTMQSINNEEENGEKFVFGVEHDETGSLTEEKLSFIETTDDATEVLTASRKSANSKHPESHKSDDSVCASKEQKKDTSKATGSVSSRISKAASMRHQSDKSIASRDNASQKSRASISSRKSKKSIPPDASKVEITMPSNPNNDAASAQSKVSIHSKKSHNQSQVNNSVQSKPRDKELLDASECGSHMFIPMVKSEPMPVIHHSEAPTPLATTHKKVSTESQTTKSVHNHHEEEPPQQLATPPVSQTGSNLHKVPSSIQGDAIAFANTPSQITWTSMDSQADYETEDGIETIVVAVPGPTTDHPPKETLHASNDGMNTDTTEEEERTPVNLDHANADTLLIHEAMTAVTKLKEQAAEKATEQYTGMVHRFRAFCCP